MPTTTKRKNNFSDVKQAMKKEIQNSKKILNTVSRMEVGSSAYVDDELKAKRTLIKKPVVKFKKDEYLNQMAVEDKERISALPGFLSLDAKEEHTDYKVDLYFQYKKLLTETYCKVKIIDDLTIKDILGQTERCYVAKIPGWNDESVFATGFTTYYNNYKNANFAYTVAMVILSHMALSENFDDWYDETYHFNPFHKKEPENPNVNLSKRMVSADLFYYTPGIGSLYNQLTCHQEYVDWLLENSHLSFERKFNKGIDFWIKGIAKNAPKISMEEYTKKRYKNPKKPLSKKIANYVAKHENSIETIGYCTGIVCGLGGIGGIIGLITWALM